MKTKQEIFGKIKETIKFLSKLIIFNLFIQGYSTEVKNPFLNSCELYLNESFYSPKTVFKEKDFSLSTLSTIYGIKLSLSFCDLRFYQKIKTLPISSINSFTEYFDFSSNLQSTVWSSTIDFENIFSSTMNKKIPLKFYAGSFDKQEETVVADSGRIDGYSYIIHGLR